MLTFTLVPRDAAWGSGLRRPFAMPYANCPFGVTATDVGIALPVAYGLPGSAVRTPVPLTAYPEITVRADHSPRGMRGVCERRQKFPIR